MDERVKFLKSELGTILGPKWRSYLKDANLYTAFSDAQRELSLQTLCVKSKVELSLDIAEAEYLAGGNVHRIREVLVPEGYQRIEPIEPENWNATVIEKRLTGNPQYVTMLFGMYTFNPAPVAAFDITLWVALKPSEDGSDNVSEDYPPITPEEYDEELIHGAAYRCLRKIPKDDLVLPEFDSLYYQGLFTAGIVRKAAQLNRVQNRNPRSMREEYRF